MLENLNIVNILDTTMSITIEYLKSFSSFAIT